jgi:hypothetical protein
MDTWHRIEQFEGTEAARIGENGFGRRRKLSSAIIDLRKRSEKKAYNSLPRNCFHHSSFTKCLAASSVSQVGQHFNGIRNPELGTCKLLLPLLGFVDFVSKYVSSFYRSIGAFFVKP